MKTKIYIFFLLLTYSFGLKAQVSTLPNSIGIGQTINAAIPLHINKPGEVARFQGASPYVTFYNSLNFQGYIQAIGDHLEIGSKNNYNIDFYTNNLPQFRIDGTSGQITAFQKINANSGIRLSGPLQAEYESVGSPGSVLVSRGNATPAWEDQKVGFQASTPTAVFVPLLHGTETVINSFTEAWDYANCFNPATGTFTANSAGLYHFQWSFILINTGAIALNSGFCAVNMEVNGSVINPEVNYTFKALAGYSSSTIQGFRCIKLNQNDQVKFKIYQSNESNTTVSLYSSGGSNLDPIFQAYKIF